LRKLLVIATLTILVLSSVLVYGTGLAGAELQIDGTSGKSSRTEARKITYDITKFEGDLESKEYVFGDGGGTFSDLNVTIPKRATVLSATVDLEGLPLLEEFKYDYMDKVNNSAWKDFTSQLPPTSSPSNFKDTAFSNSDYRDIQSKNNIMATTEGGSSPNATSRPVQLYKFKVTDQDTSNFNFYWYGESWATNPAGTGYNNELSIYVYCPTNTTWVLLSKQTSATVAMPAKLTVDKTKPGASSYVDSDLSMYFIAIGNIISAGFTKGMLGADYVQLKVYAGNEYYPTGAALNVGADADNEWTKVGQFKNKVTIGDSNNFKTELQEHIDAAGTEVGTMSVKFKIGSESKGRIWIGDLNISIVALEPNNPPIEISGELTHFYMTEDDETSGDNLIDLGTAFSDDHDDNQTLVYAIVEAGDPGTLEAVLDSDGHHVDFIPAENFFGTVMFRVKATDSGADELPDTFDDLVCLSRFFNVTVNPVNDAPEIILPAEQFNVNESAELKFAATVTDVDDDTFTWESNDTARVIVTPDTQNSSNAEVVFNHLQKDLSKSVTFNLKVLDSGGSQGEQFLAAGYVNVTVDVININNPPKFVELTIMPDEYTEPMIAGAPTVLNKDNSALEDEYFNLSLSVEDPDLGIDLDEKLTFTLTPEDPAPEGTLEIDAESGQVTFLPTNADVGTVKFSVKVSDWKGESAEHDIEVNVKNRNDKPYDIKIIEPYDREFTTDDTINFSGRASDDDFDVPDSTEELTYMWYSNHSSVLLGTGKELKDISLEAGWHEITLRVGDSEGEYGSDSIVLIVTQVDIIDDQPDDDDKPGDNKDDGDPKLIQTPDEKEGGSSFWMLLAAIIVAVVVALVLFAVIRSRRKKEEEEPEDDDEHQPVMPFGPGYMGMQYGQVPPQMQGMGGQMDYYTAQQMGMPYYGQPQQVFPQQAAFQGMAAQPQPGLSQLPAAPQSEAQVTEQMTTSDPLAITVDGQKPSAEQLEGVQNSDLPKTRPVEK
jgi:hypothetical protein